MTRCPTLALGLAVHLVVALAHGATHGLVPVTLPAWQNAVVIATVFVGPVLGLVLDRNGNPAGVPLFTATMAAAFLVGATLHLVVENPDHLRQIPADPWRQPFQVTGLAVVATPAVGAVLGARRWWLDGVTNGRSD
jgi:hypothetical protein